jgi:hemerythrin-like domain-containing protein
VHTHHNLEDIALFPRLRRFHPALSSVIDKLEADHVVVSNYLDTVEAVADRLDTDEAARITLAHALNELAEHLLTHLDYEEANISPTLRRMDGWQQFST